LPPKAEGGSDTRPASPTLVVDLEENGHGVKTVIVQGLGRLARDQRVQESVRGRRGAGTPVKTPSKVNAKVVRSAERGDLSGRQDRKKGPFAPHKAEYPQSSRALILLSAVSPLEFTVSGSVTGEAHRLPFGDADHCGILFSVSDTRGSGTARRSWPLGWMATSQSRLIWPNSSRQRQGDGKKNDDARMTQTPACITKHRPICTGVRRLDVATMRTGFDG